MMTGASAYLRVGLDPVDDASRDASSETRDDALKGRRNVARIAHRRLTSNGRAGYRVGIGVVGDLNDIHEFGADMRHCGFNAADEC